MLYCAPGESCIGAERAAAAGGAGGWRADCPAGAGLRGGAGWPAPVVSCAGGAGGSAVMMFTGGIEDDDGK